MTQQTRKEYGKMWKLGLVNNDPSLQKCYLEFKDDIDEEIDTGA